MSNGSRKHFPAMIVYTMDDGRDGEGDPSQTETIIFLLDESRREARSSQLPDEPIVSFRESTDGDGDGHHMGTYT